MKSDKILIFDINNYATKMRSKKQNELLELAWRTAFDSSTYHVTGDGTESQDLIEQAKEHIRQIDREDWFPEANKILQEGSHRSDHRLAEDASSNFINKKMGTKNLKVTLGGDW